MPSLQSRLLIFVIRNRHLLRFRLKRDAGIGTLRYLTSADSAKQALAG